MPIQIFSKLGDHAPPSGTNGRSYLTVVKTEQGQRPEKILAAVEKLFPKPVTNIYHQHG